MRHTGEMQRKQSVRLPSTVLLTTEETNELTGSLFLSAPVKLSSCEGGRRAGEGGQEEEESARFTLQCAPYINNTHLLAVLEHHEGWHGSDADFLGNIFLLVDVNLGGESEKARVQREGEASVISIDPRAWNDAIETHGVEGRVGVVLLILSQSVVDWADDLSAEGGVEGGLAEVHARTRLQRGRKTDTRSQPFTVLPSFKSDAVSMFVTRPHARHTRTLHGPHHSAEKSMKTGLSPAMTSLNCLSPLIVGPPATMAEKMCRFRLVGRE